MKPHLLFLVLELTVVLCAVLTLHWAGRFDLPNEQRQIGAIVLFILSVFHITNTIRDFQEVLELQKEIPD